MTRTLGISSRLYSVQILFALTSLLFFFSSCQPQVIEEVPIPYIPSSAHEGYIFGLETSGMSNKALGQVFIDQAITNIEQAVRIGASFKEKLIITQEKHRAFQYKINVDAGQRLEISLASENNSTLFLDVFRHSSDSTSRYVPIASAPLDSFQLSFDVNQSNTYLIRLQPELLVEDKIIIQIKRVPSMLFPVSGKNEAAIGSLFGVPRDAGKRTHEGVDIFAKRHTPIIAPVSGQINSTKDNELGGKVVWLSNIDNTATLYFAHLESILVKEGEQVNKGDTIATVGNSGNAKSTYPHLHFGIYKDGAVDPYPYIVNKDKGTKKQLAYDKYLGALIRTNKHANFRKNSVLRKGERISIAKHAIYQIIGTHAAYYKVALDDQNTGYIFYDDIESIVRPIGTLSATSQYSEYVRADKNSVSLGTCCEDQPLSLLGYANDLVLVEDQNSSRHWLAVSAPK